MVTPNRVNIGSVTGISSATEKPTAPEIIQIFDGLIDNHPHKYRNRENVFIVSPEDYDLYVRSRAQAVAPKNAGFGNTTGDVSVNNTYRESITNTWIAPPYRGFNIVSNPFKKYIGQSYSGSEVIPNIIFAPLEEFYVGAQTRIDQDRRHEPRSDAGGPAIEITKHFWIDFQIRNREACSIAYYGAQCEEVVLATSNDVKSSSFVSADDALTAATTVYPYCDTKDVRIFVGVSETSDAAATALVATLATAVGNIGTGAESAAELTAGEAYVITEAVSSRTYFSFVAFKDGILLRSDAVTLDVNIS